ncbi:MAG: TonB-dependent receptor, partial [Gammaproteobacteria bacterium]|nr:TonB-dependent receptor [Gammaproteobacteria bacterium]
RRGVTPSHDQGTNAAHRGDEDDGYRNTTWHANSGYRGTNWSLRGVARSMSADVEYDPTPYPAFVPEDGNVEGEVDNDIARLDLRLWNDSGWQHRITADYFDSTNVALEDGRRTSSTDADRVSLGYQSAWAFESRVLSHTLTAAIEYERSRYRQRGIPSPFGDPNQNEHIDSVSAIADWTGTVRGEVALSVSVRHDDNSAFADANSVRAALRAPLWQDSTLYASYGTGSKNPTFTDRFGYTPDTFIGNPDLEVERSAGYSIAVAQRFSGGHVEAAYFNERLEDEINGFVFDVERAAFTAANESGASRRRGIELSAAYRSVSLPSPPATLISTPTNLIRAAPRRRYAAPDTAADCCSTSTRYSDCLCNSARPTSATGKISTSARSQRDV